MITERFAGKTTVWIDGAQGNIDMILHGIPYELTSSICVGNSIKKSNDLAGRYQYRLEVVEDVHDRPRKPDREAQRSSRSQANL